MTDSNVTKELEKKLLSFICELCIKVTLKRLSGQFLPASRKFMISWKLLPLLMNASII